MEHNISAIGISETWFNNDSPQPSLEGYTFYSNTREDREAGGIGLFVKDTFHVIIRHDLNK